MFFVLVMFCFGLRYTKICLLVSLFAGVGASRVLLKIKRRGQTRPIHVLQSLVDVVSMFVQHELNYRVSY